MSDMSGKLTEMVEKGLVLREKLHLMIEVGGWAVSPLVRAGTVRGKKRAVGVNRNSDARNDCVTAT